MTTWEIDQMGQPIYQKKQRDTASELSNYRVRVGDILDCSLAYSSSF